MKKARSLTLLSVASLLVRYASVTASGAGRPLEEFKVKRETVFAFAKKPTVTREGDRISIAFESRGFCDATISIENAKGRIVRHLACGVLGLNAPEPFRKNSKKQVVVWDSKDDQGIYVKDKDALRIRVSLGLNPRFERTLFWSPKKRIGPGSLPNLASAPKLCPRRRRRRPHPPVRPPRQLRTNGVPLPPGEDHVLRTTLFPVPRRNLRQSDLAFA